jgi:hypothetical protein
MNWTGRVFWLLALFGAAVAASPAVATADPNAVLYEVTETMNVRGGKMVRRLAVAALSGTVNAGPALCPVELAVADALGVKKCSINAIAHDNINLATGRGPITGTFAIVVQEPTSPVDGLEMVIIRGTVTGQIDLSPAVLSGVPLGTMTGTWSATGVQGGPMHGFRGHGTLTGTFRLPFDIAPGVPAYMLQPSAFAVPNPSPVPGTDFVFVNLFDPDADPKSEFSLGFPTVRLEIEFETR